MKKTPKMLRTLALLLVMVLSMTACGGNSQTPAAGTTAPAAPNVDSAGGESTAGSADDVFNPNPGVAPTKAGAQPPVVDKETVKVALTKTFSDLDGMASITTSFGISNAIVEQLTIMQADGTVKPLLATSWERVDDYTWRFHLREGVKFSNGDDFNADSAVESINVGMNAFRTYRYYKYYGPSWPIEASKVDEYTIDVKTSAPNAKIPELMNRVAMWPCGASDDPEFAKNPIGTGPYVLESWELGSRVVITRKADGEYWGEESPIKTIIFDIIENEQARDAALKAGEYDIVQGVPLETAYEMLTDNQTGMNLLTATSFTMEYILWNGFSESKFVQDKAFRQACTYAIDYEAIQESLLYGLMPMASGIAPNNPVLEGNWDGPGYPDYDPEKARELLAECGYNGEELIFYYSSAQFTNDLQISESICAYLNAVGVNVKFEQIDSASWQTYKRTPVFALSANNVAGTSTCDVEFYYTQGCGDVGWSWEEPNEILNKLYAEGVTEEERTALLIELQEVLWDLQPFLWCSEWNLYYAINPNLNGFYFTPQNIVYINELSWQ